ncbi:growth hormone receptor a isoform X3 [Nothobranchius furzeri]|uniref:Growth hormone receptor a n=5 Tax=Nothobranchius TaxID=28779 RepID=A0A8C6LKS5_NOTFU|nr:transcript variant X1 [Nothobranchius furzeri]
MAVSLSYDLLLLLVISSLDWSSTPGSAFLTDHNRMTSSGRSEKKQQKRERATPVEPHFTECMSRDLETFRCWWSPGTFHNLSSPEELRVFYLKRNSPSSEWKECPEYSHLNRECFFDANHTSIWIPYCLQLRGQNNITYFNEDDCFSVENIVRPDPPVSLNWTLLIVSPSGLSYDVMVSWEPPPSADVSTGWMRIEYEIQYRERNATTWEALETQPHTQQTIYGLQAGTEYEVHIRTKMKGFPKFGDFSDSIFVKVTEIPLRESAVLLTLVLTFGVAGILILIMLIVVSHQQRLMMILLPPVPAPKIKGIDSELLKKGKLEELDFILNGGGLGGLPTYISDYYQDEPWVEFIEVDEEDADCGEKEDQKSSDTQRLLGLPQRSVGCFSADSHPDDDSGRASCYDTDLSEQDTHLLAASLLPGQPEDEEAFLHPDEKAPASETNKSPLIQTESEGKPTWINTDLYAQVSNVMPSGGVVLSPGQQLRIQENTEKESQKKGTLGEDTSKLNKPQFQLLVVDPDGSGYTSEITARQISTPPSSLVPGEGYQTIYPQPMETKPAAPSEPNQSPYILPDSPQTRLFAPVADYTVVQELDTHQSLLLNLPTQQPPPPCLPQHPLKAPVAIGYVTPDLLGNLSS